MSSTTPSITVFRSDGQSTIHLLDGEMWRIGRATECDIVVDATWISRHHAMIQRSGRSEYFVMDLGSRNGTFLNGVRIQSPMRLVDGDVVSFCQVASEHPRLKFTCMDDLSLSPLQLGWLDKSETAQVHPDQLITVLVMDIRDFTKLAHEMDTRELSGLISSWNREAGRIIESCGCSIDKYIGDAIMATWVHHDGNPSTSEARQIIEALIRLWKMSQTLEKRFRAPFALRVGAGINTGMASLGNKGTPSCPDYTPIGDSVNHAFRFESSTKELSSDVVIGKLTFEVFVSAFDRKEVPFTPRVVALKGISSKQTVYTASFLDIEKFAEQI